MNHEEEEKAPEAACKRFGYNVYFEEVDGKWLNVKNVVKTWDCGLVYEEQTTEGWEILNGMAFNKLKDMEIPSEDDPMFKMVENYKDNNGWEYGKDMNGNMQRCRMKPKMDGDDYLNKEKDDMEDMEDMKKQMKHVISECNPNDDDSCGVDHKCGMATSSNEKYNQVLETIGWHCYKQFFCGKEIDGVKLDCNGYIEEDMEKEPHQKE